VSTDLVLCYDGTAEFNITNLNTVNAGGQWLYDVTVNYPAGVTGDWTAGLLNQSVLNLSDNLLNSTNDVQIVTYTFTPKIDRGGARPLCEDGVAVVIEIEVNPRPRIDVSTDLVLCYDGTAEFNITNLNTVNAGGQWLYDVTVNYPAGVTGDWTAGLLNQSVLNLSDNLLNSTNDVQIVTYTLLTEAEQGLYVKMAWLLS
jgi:hypothetical protein